MTTVILHGALAEVAGQSEWRLDIQTPVELFRAIEANTGRMFTFLQENASALYAFVVDGEPLKTPEDFALIQRPMAKVEVFPVLAGAGNNGLGMLIAGLVIIAVSLFLPVFGPAAGAVAAGNTGATTLWAAWTTAATATFGQTLAFTVGLSLTLSGVSQMMMPTPEADRERPENKPSYLYDGAVNSMRQGNPVPVGFGFLRVGSQVISASVRAAEVTEDDKEMYV